MKLAQSFKALSFGACSGFGRRPQKFGKSKSLHDVETLIVGAGVVGLAVARHLALAGQDVLVIEQHDIIGSETSARNSEVILAGIYYPRDSHKARLCLRGKQMLYRYCESHGVPHRRLGKLIVATDQKQVEELTQIRHRAEQNGVDDLRLLDQAALMQREPHLRGMAALHSPSTGIIDSHAYMLALQGDAENHGCQIAFLARASRWSHSDASGYAVTCIDAAGESTTITARNLVVSGGLHANRFLSSSNNPLAAGIAPLKFAKGNYFRLDSGRAPFSHLIYPVPEPGGLGTHLTLDMAGQARFGPDVEWIDQVDYEVDPARGEKFYQAIRNYWPGLPDGALVADYAGIRPKLSGPGQASADFVLWGPKDHGMAGLVGLLGIESPGLTASLAIAEDVAAALPRR